MSESSTLCEGEGWPSSLLGPKSKALALPSTDTDSDGEKEAVFGRLEPGKRPDTIVLRGVPANWLGSKGRAAEGTEAPVSEAFAVFERGEVLSYGGCIRRRSR